MAYVATTAIKVGVDGKKYRFAAGDTVTGLDRETMVKLWEAGAITQVPDPEPAESESESEPAKSEGGSSEGTDSKKE